MHLSFGQRWFSWTRLFCLLGTVLLLVLVFRRIDFSALLESLRRMRGSWALLAMLVYGGALMAGAWRWHVALRATERVIHFLASWRLSLAGHFFFTVFFGMVGGDAAKSVVYARWFRFPLPEVLAAAPLDRLLSLGGALVLAGLTLVLAGTSGGLERWRATQFDPPGVGLALSLILLAALAAIFLWKPDGESFFARTIRALRSGGRRLAVSPGMALPGLASAFTAQAALSAVFAFNLAAVSATPIPWAQVAWTFPAITTISCLPFTFAGAGVREVAALALLGMYGVPPADCVAASLLTMTMKLAWAAVGAISLSCEETKRGRSSRPVLPANVSVIIPTLNEAAALEETVRRARANPEVIEIIVTDGGSTDGTGDLAARLGCRVITGPAGRGSQLRRGVAEARGEVLMFLHADTWLPPHAARAALNCLRDETVAAGGFWKVYENAPPLLLGSRLKCALRLLFARRILGDQAMFVRREELARTGGVPEMDLMEEYELCRRWRRAGRLALAEATVVTSARRFAKQGVLRMAWLTCWLRLRYRLGAAPSELRRIYEKG